MKKFSVTVNQRAYQVVLKQQHGGSALVEVDGIDYQVALQSESSPVEPAARPHSAPVPVTIPVSGPSAAHLSAPGRLLAPLPGMITQIRVSVGQAVKNGDIVCIMEAMKMENEIKSHTDGTIRSILVKAGDTLQEGSPICEIA
ncbi:MAG: acetyl-CoA carboxylase biotin carboxyl carrier protein subunit [Candidatus Delongbacteria bacterium]|nr:acetyl-CoA carboxylase biotin carboxyl carrier protein subunit [Candidatus Delongbacteria bacterium]